MHCKLPYNSVPGLILISHGVTGALSRIMCTTSSKLGRDNEMADKKVGKVGRD